MKRLLATIACDVRIQLRNGFYYASAFLAVFFILALYVLTGGAKPLVARESLAWVMPIVLLSNMMSNTYYFLAGLVLLEKGEGTLEAQVVSPLLRSEYLASKVITLVALTLVENTAIVVAIFGVQVNWPLLIGAILCGSLIYAMLGFITVASYDSVNEFLMPSILYTMLIAAPIFPYCGLWEGWGWYLHPVTAPLVLLEAAFVGKPPGAKIYGAVYGLVWIAILSAIALRSYARFVIARNARAAA